MSERFKDGADPDATVMLPAGAKRALDEDATVMIPAARVEDDATVMMPVPKPDDDATVMMPAPKPDEDATVMIPAAAREPEEPDPEATIAIPTPGRRRDAEAPALPAAPVAAGAAEPVDMGALGGINRLVAAANPVLGAVAQIRHALKHPDPPGLQASLRERVDAFEAAARATGADEATVTAACFALCALVDESAGSTPWGAGWVAAGLLRQKHDGQGGADEFFRLLEEKSADPAANRDLLEFFLVCLALGFEGPYRQQADGRRGLAELRGKLLEQLRGPGRRAVRTLARRACSGTATCECARVLGGRLGGGLAACRALCRLRRFVGRPFGPGRARTGATQGSP